MLSDGKVLQSAIVNFSCAGNKSLFGQELGVVEPDLGHLAHVDQALLVQVIDDFIVGGLFDQVELLHILAGLLEEIILQLVAARQILKGAFVKLSPLLVIFERHGLDGVPPLSEGVPVTQIEGDFSFDGVRGSE